MTDTASHLLNRGNNVFLEVLTNGSQNTSNPPIVLLPSSLRDSYDFDVLAKRLANAGFKVLRPQPRGMGRSSAPQMGMTLHTLADDVAFAIEHLAVAPAVVAGHAFGHFVARVTDLDHPHLVCGVALLASAAFQFPAGMSNLAEIAASPEHTVPKRLSSLQAAFFAPDNDPSCWLTGWYPHLRDAYEKAKAVPSKDRWWMTSHSPILDMQAEYDPWRPPHTRLELKNRLGDKVTIEMIANASHALIPEQPQKVADVLVSWIGNSCQSSAPTA